MFPMCRLLRTDQVKAAPTAAQFRNRLWTHRPSILGVVGPQRRRPVLQSRVLFTVSTNAFMSTDWEDPPQARDERAKRETARRESSQPSSAALGQSKPPFARNPQHM